MNEIIQKEHAVLRQVAKEVPIEDIKSRKIETIIRRMIKALDNEEDGIAIAAPQIGESLRIFVVSKKIYEIMDEIQNKKTSSKRENLNKFENNQRKEKDKNLVFINPEILKSSKKKIKLEEGCLSVRWLYGKVERAEKTLVKAYNEEGVVVTLGGSGILSQVFQHEIDHLNGILFIDKAKNLEEILPKQK